MLIVVSPAKTLDYESPVQTETFTKPDHLRQSQQLINRLRDCSVLDLIELQHVSNKIAALNFQRNHQWKTPFTPKNARQALFAFKGDVYTGLDAYSLTEKNLTFAQDHLRILSGLYGLLRPLDLIRPYRLEMGSKLSNSKGKNLYQFWGMQLTDAINRQLATLHTSTLVNLASNEYFKVIKNRGINGQIITPVFRDFSKGEYRTIGFYAKKARGLMSRYIIDNELTDIEGLKHFDSAGYQFKTAMSEGHRWVFARRL